MSKNVVEQDVESNCPKSPFTVAIDDVVIGKRFRRNLGRLESLVCSIREIGLLHPIVVTADRRLVAGQRRLEACRMLGWTDIPAKVVNLEDTLRAEHDENTVRKDFSPSEAVAIAQALKERERERAKANQAAAGPAAGKGKKTGGGKLPPAVKGKTRDRIAKRVGMSGKTLAKAEAVVKAAAVDPDKYQQLVEEMDRTGKVDGAHRQLRALRRPTSARSPSSPRTAPVPAASTPVTATPPTSTIATTSTSSPSGATPTTDKVSGMVMKLYTSLNVIAEEIEAIESRIEEVPVTERTELRRRAEATVEHLQSLLAVLGPAAA